MHTCVMCVCVCERELPLYRCQRPTTTCTYRELRPAYMSTIVGNHNNIIYINIIMFIIMYIIMYLWQSMGERQKLLETIKSLSSFLDNNSTANVASSIHFIRWAPRVMKTIIIILLLILIYIWQNGMLSFSYEN